MPPTRKAAAPKLGPSGNKAATQPPWAMVSADGSELFYPQSADDARELLGQGAKPVDPALWPWPSEVPLDNAPVDFELPADNDPLPPEALGDDPGDPVTQPAQLPAAAPEAIEGTMWHSCPTPALCWPLGLPADVSYVTCQHGAWAIGD